MTDKLRFRVTHERPVYAYSEFYHASYVMLRIAKEFGKGQQSLYLASITMTAFTFEAYLNHVGPRISRDWITSFDKSNWQKKFNEICRILDVSFPGGWGGRPLQDVQALFNFRDSVAHARTEEAFVEERIVEGDAAIPMLDQLMSLSIDSTALTSWEKRLRNDKYALEARDLVEKVLGALHEKRPDKREPIFTFGVSSGSVSLVEDWENKK